ncbi:MAG: DUF4249 domain-containing protein [Saprospiraceae bacterium]|nr:DUF4249 domain-containing protein [Saprospiraceae bacterium]
MIKLIYKISFLTLVFGLTSCEDFFNTTIDIDPPVYEPTIVIDCIHEKSKDSMYFRIARNVGVFDNNTDFREAMLSDAEVNVFVNGSSFPVAPVNSVFSHNFMVDFGGDLQTGDEVTITAKHPGYPDASVLQKVLPSSEVVSVTFKEDGGLDSEGSEVSLISVRINDKPGKNYYAFRLLELGLFGSYNERYASSIDPSVSESYQNNGLLISDTGFDGTEKILDFQVPQMNLESALALLKVEWYDISEHHYVFSRALLNHFNSVDNPFSTPVQVPTNVKGGLGSFEIKTLQVLELE